MKEKRRKEISVLISSLLDRDPARLPNATRVAQLETYDLLRAYGVIDIRGKRGASVGAGALVQILGIC